MRSLAAWTVVAMATVTASCASAGGSGGGGTASCTSDLAPSASPLTEVLDSAAARQGIESIWPASAGLTVARLGAESSDITRPVQVWSQEMTAEERSAVADVLHASSRLLFGSGRRGYLFVGDSTGPALRRVDGLSQCPPRILNPRSISRKIAAAAAGLGIDQLLVVQLQVFVEPNGSVREVRIDESSGDFRVDRAASEAFRTERFIPAVVEGIPVSVWASFPVRFRPASGPDVQSVQALVHRSRFRTPCAALLDQMGRC